MKARYIRVSTKQQNTARQEAKQNPDEVIFTDVISGTVPFKDRPEAKRLLFNIAMGEVNQVSISSIDRLGRNTADILNTLEQFRKSDVNVKVDNLGIESLPNGTPNPVFELITSVMASISQMERQQLRERQLEGIEQAKKAGTYKGREKGSRESVDKFLSKHTAVVKALKKHPNLSLREIAKQATSDDYKPSHGTVKKVKEMIEKKAAG